MPRTVDREARRAELVSAAASIFAEQGVAGSSVSDVVKAAGVAQGTFYLYFDSKDDVVLAVVQRIADTVEAAVRVAVADRVGSAVEQLRGLCAALADLTAVPGAEEVITFVHAPKNRAIHDSLVNELTPKLVAIVEGIVERGIGEGVFDVPDRQAAAWFVLGGLQAAELSGVPLPEMPAALTTATEFALRALGYRGAPRSPQKGGPA